MRVAEMSIRERAAGMTAIQRRLEQAAIDGARYGPLLLEEDPATWRQTMRGDSRYRSFGTLEYLLRVARDKFVTAPTDSHEITATVVDFVDAVVDAPSRVHHTQLRGLAWKEHGNACQLVGKLREALAAARRAVEVYGQSPALVFDQTKARLVVAKVLREMGETDEPMEIARSCIVTFRDFGDVGAMNMARMFEGGVLFSLKQFAQALALFTDVMEEAERSGDRVTLAQCLHCAANCARELGMLAAAHDLYPRALSHFEELNVQDDANCVRWGYALCLAAEGKVSAATSELFKVRAVFLHLGMNALAAGAALDIVRLKFESGEDVRDLCASLVVTFTEAGMAQNALEALAYLREQAKTETLTKRKISCVRTYFNELAKKPNLLFVRPFESEQEG